MRARIDEHRTEATRFDIVMEGTTPGDRPGDAAEIVRPWTEAAATWWLEAMWDAPDLEPVLARIRQDHHGSNGRGPNPGSEAGESPVP